MDDDLKVRSAQLSRRYLLRNAAFAAGGAAILGTVAGSRRADAATKATQKVVAYQDTPKGAQRCDNCLHFEPASSCKVVEGTIAAAGWCKVYAKAPASG